MSRLHRRMLGIIVLSTFLGGAYLLLKIVWQYTVPTEFIIPSKGDVTKMLVCFLFSYIFYKLQENY